MQDAVRLGKRDPSKRQFLKVSVPSLSVKKSILRNSFKLCNKSDPDWMKKVFITPDFTPKKQETNRELRKRLAEMNGSGKVYRIKNGLIVRREGPLPWL